jgi:hypothetical protein
VKRFVQLSFLILSRVLVTETGFGLVVGCINRLRMVITINYNTVTNFHSTSTPRHFSESVPTYLHHSFPGNGYQHRNYRRLTLQILHINLLFTEAFFTTHAENSTDNCSHEVFFNYEPSTVVFHLALENSRELTNNSYCKLLQTLDLTFVKTI